MKRTVTYIILLVLGLAAGAATMWLYTGGPGLAPMDEAAKRPDKRVLFYRNPMNPEMTSPTPRKDEMGMDYVPVYEEEAPGEPGEIVLSPEKVQKIGVRSEEVRRRTLKRVIRTVGRVEPVENMIYNINTKVPGWVEKLYLNRTDQMVQPGEALLELYSPDLVAAQDEYLLAYRSYDKVKESPYEEVRIGARALLDSARKRLKYWDISDDQIKRLETAGKITRTMVIKSPAYGSVTEKMVVEGQKIEAGEPLFRIIDHSRVWVYGEIYEYEIPYIRSGQTASLSPSYSPGELYSGRIEHIYSHLGSIRYETGKEPEVRTAKVRFELSNPEMRLKLGMFMNVELSVVVAGDALSVPDSAVIDTGERQIVIVDRLDGRFKPVPVKVGSRGTDYVEVIGGVKEGDRVVTSANFLLDSESNLKAAVGAMRGGDAPEGGPLNQGPPAPGHAGH